MKTAFTYKFYFLLLFASIFFNPVFAQQEAKKGVIDLKKYNFKETGIIDLNGTWEFYPEKLYTPADFSSGSVNNAKFVKVPSLWNKSFFNKEDNFNIGYGTYHLKVLIPDSIGILALRLKRIETAYVLWVNNDTLVHCGKTAEKENLYSPAQNTRYKFFNASGNSFDITVQVSNFSHRKGGIDSPISLGLPNQITNKTKTKRGVEIFIVGVLLIMAVFHFGLYFVKRKDYSLLFFGLLLISEIISISVNGEMILTATFPDMSWATLKKTDYISNFMRSTFLVLFFYKIYEEEISKLYVQILIGINLSLTVFVLFTDLLTYSFTLLVFIATATLTMLYIIYAQIRGIVKKKEGALIPFLGTFLLLLSAVNDILYVSDIIDTMFLTPVGMFIFIFSQSYLLSFNFSNLYKKTEELNKMTADLDDIKNSLLEKKSFDYVSSLEILTEHATGTRGILFSVADNTVIYKSEFPEIDSRTETKDRFPSELINEVIEKEEIIVSSPVGSKLFNSSYISKFRPKSAACLSLKAAGKTRAVLYFENEEKKHVFNKQKIQAFKHVSDQIIGTIDNVDMYKELESLSSNLEGIILSRTKDVRNQNEMLTEQKDEIEAINHDLNKTLDEVNQKNKIIKDSIVYAKYLQDANIPDEKYINTLFKDSFVLNKPKETLGGDFYWVHNKKQEDEEKIIFAIADCTGHGIPGALISVIGYDMLNHVVINENTEKPSEILNLMQEEIGKRLAKDNDEEIKDGMEAAVITYDKTANILEYAGARISLVIFRNGKMTEVKADRISISAFQHEKIKGQKFANHKIQLKKDDIVYLFTDGFQDQFGGETDSKFMKKNFRKLLEEVNQRAFPVQRSHMLKTLNRWQGKNIQNDDILVVGLKF
ncbi:MAG: SpoIIE family protein phosphatase [Bacteroidales bacterium]|nr:SpoIIE family protein phosphatase [Bacteroidales bacterium]